MIDRRTFVFAGSTAAVGFAFTPQLFASTSPRGFISVGYSVAVRRTRGRNTNSPVGFVPADTLASGDPGLFENGARLRLHDYHRGSGRRDAERLTIDVMFPSDRPDVKIPFHAWSASSANAAYGNSVAFQMPVASIGTIDLRVERTVSGAALESIVVPFSVNSTGNTVKIKSGLYALAFLRAGEPIPDWNAIQPDGVRSGKKVQPLRLLQRTFSAERLPVSFDYILMSVAYPSLAESSASGDLDGTEMQEVEVE